MKGDKRPLAPLNHATVDCVKNGKLKELKNVYIAKNGKLKNRTVYCINNVKLKNRK